MTTALAKARAARRVPLGAEAILAALPDAVLLIDEDGVVRRANPAAEQFFALGATLLCGGPLARIVPPASPLVELVAKARESASSLAQYEVDLSSPRTGARAVDLQAIALAEQPGWVVATLRERSIARRLGRQLTHLGAGRSVAGIAAALAHEVKNPLSGIRGAAQLLDRVVGDEDRELTRLITAEANRICRLVDRMGVFADDAPVERDAVNIHEVLEHVRRIAQSGFGRRLRFVERYDPSLPPVFGNRDALVQVFLNLVKNAALAAPESGGEIVLATAFEPGVRLMRGGGEGTLRLPLVASIQDNGPGVPAELRGHLFDPFVSGRSDGTGLGLALVAKAVAEHGGIVEFESAPGRTVFRVRLPLLDAGETGEERTP